MPTAWFRDYEALYHAMLGRYHAMHGRCDRAEAEIMDQVRDLHKEKLRVCALNSELAAKDAAIANHSEEVAGFQRDRRSLQEENEGIAILSDGLQLENAQLFERNMQLQRELEVVQQRITVVTLELNQKYVKAMTENAQLQKQEASYLLERVGLLGEAIAAKKRKPGEQ